MAAADLESKEQRSRESGRALQRWLAEEMPSGLSGAPPLQHLHLSSSRMCASGAGMPRREFFGTQPECCCIGSLPETGAGGTSKQSAAACG